MTHKRSSLRPLSTLLVFAAFVVLLFVLAKRLNTEQHPVTEMSRHPCVATHADGRMEGILTAKFDEGKKLVGWSCTMMVHMNCTAGPDGVWSSCDYPPDMGWPEPVPADALANPSLYAQDSSSPVIP